MGTMKRFINDSKRCGGVMRVAPVGLMVNDPEEALSISLYCALCADGNFKKGVLLAVNHSGDSDSTGAITGNILGCLLGNSAIPGNWTEQLELKDIIRELGIDLFIQFRDDQQWWNQYPGW
jgi:ADP-ribosylglycohydrolase